MTIVLEVPGAIVSIRKVATVHDPSVFCDNFKTCGGTYLGRGSLDKTIEVARARGWHFYQGPNLAGTYWMSVSLCPTCTQSQRRALPKAGAPLEGQMNLFEEEDG